MRGFRRDRTPDLQLEIVQRPRHHIELHATTHGGEDHAHLVQSIRRIPARRSARQGPVNLVNHPGVHRGHCAVKPVVGLPVHVDHHVFARGVRPEAKIAIAPIAERVVPRGGVGVVLGQETVGWNLLRNGEAKIPDVLAVATSHRSQPGSRRVLPFVADGIGGTRLIRERSDEQGGRPGGEKLVERFPLPGIPRRQLREIPGHGVRTGEALRLLHERTKRIDAARRLRPVVRAGLLADIFPEQAGIITAVEERQPLRIVQEVHRGRQVGGIGPSILIGGQVILHQPGHALQRPRIPEIVPALDHVKELVRSHHVLVGVPEVPADARVAPHGIPRRSPRSSILTSSTSHWLSVLSGTRKSQPRYWFRASASASCMFRATRLCPCASRAGLTASIGRKAFSSGQLHRSIRRG